MTRKSRILAAVSAGLMFCLAARGAQNVSLAWSASTDPTTTGYMLHYGTASRAYTSEINVGTNTVITLSGLKAGQTYFFAVGGYDKSGVEGMLSNEASFATPTNSPPPPPAAPGSIVVTPSSGVSGTEVYIYGTNLTTATGVTFNGVPASFAVVSNTVLATAVPFGVSTGPLVVTTPSGTFSSLFTVFAGEGPANDNFASAQSLAGTAAYAWTITTHATKEPGEPNHAGNSGGASVWYNWTAPVTGAFSLDTDGTEFQPLVAIYTGSSVSQLSVVASNSASGGNPLNFQAQRGVTYAIAIDGFNGASGKLQLQLSPTQFTNLVYADSFDATEGIVTGSPLAGQHGWLSSVPKLTGVGANYFAGYGQQGFIGFSSLALASNTVALYHPLNYTVDTNGHPAIQFSVMLQSFNPLNASHSSFGWVFRNTSGQELFGVSFDDNTGFITYSLDDGKGQRSAGTTFSALASQLVITADFSHNLWSATLNGTPIIAGQPMTTAHAALTLGDIAAKAIYPGSQSGADGMFFDNYTVTAGPPLVPYILVAPQAQTVVGGGTLVTSVIAGGAGPLDYQWYFNGQLLFEENNPSLWIDDTSPEQGGTYTVVVSNPYGSVSASAVVTVSAPQSKALLATPASMGSNGRLLNFKLTTGTSYRLQTSSNLTSWSTLLRFYANGTNAAFLDSAATNFSRRFYRLASP